MVTVGSFVQWQTKSAIAEGKVKEIITDGKVPGVAIDITATPKNPAALIEVWRDKKPSGVLVAHPISAIAVTQDLLQMPEMQEDEHTTSSVTDAQLQKINAVAGAAVGMKPIRAEEVAIASFVMADNLVNRSLGKWIKKDLAILANLAIGLPFTLDHDWDSVEKSQGVIFDGRLVQKDGDRRLLDRAGNYKLNQDVVASEGHWQAIVDVAFPSYSRAIPALRFGQAGAVSAGGFGYKDYWCPICNTSFNDENCPHGIPEPQRGLTFEYDNRIAPYYIRKDVYDLGEISLVLIGNLPNAGIVKQL